MALKETTGHVLKIGDKVKMNIEVLADGDLDGVEFTKSGENYWRYMNEHPDEVYTVVGFDFSNDSPCIYKLSGAMSGNTWASDELICLPEPSSHFEIIKNMTLDEMAADLIPLLADIYEGGLPSPELMKEWLSNL